MEEMNWHTIMEHGYRFMDWHMEQMDQIYRCSQINEGSIQMIIQHTL